MSTNTDVMVASQATIQQDSGPPISRNILPVSLIQGVCNSARDLPPHSRGLHVSKGHYRNPRCKALVADEPTSSQSSNTTANQPCSKDCEHHQTHNSFFLPTGNCSVVCGARERLPEPPCLLSNTWHTCQYSSSQDTCLIHVRQATRTCQQVILLWQFQLVELFPSSRGMGCPNDRLMETHRMPRHPCPI